MTRRLFLMAVALVPLCAAQSFDAASVRPSQFQAADGEGNGRESIQARANGIVMQAVTLRASIAWAYEVQEFQIEGANSADRFDIAATTSSPVPVSTLRSMLAVLLAERFHLTFHRESRRLSSLTLVVAKGGPKPSLKASPQDAPGVLQPTRGAMAAQHATMGEFAATLSGPLRNPVLDRTGLTGRYDFTVDLNAYLADTPAPEMRDAVSSALRDQLGLNLETNNEPVEILVIDHADRAPSAN